MIPFVSSLINFRKIVAYVTKYGGLAEFEALKSTYQQSLSSEYFDYNVKLNEEG